MRGAYQTMDHMGHMGHQMPMTHPRAIPAMPLHHMPEMFIGFAALFGLIALSPAVAPRKPKAQDVAVSRPILKVVALTAALSIDVSKTSTLGFVLPGMKVEYGLTNIVASGLSVAGLAGTASGAVLARIAIAKIEVDRIYLLSAIGFMITSCCAMMPTFTGNLVMCYLMGVTVGGLAPIVVAAIRDISRDARTGGGLVILASAVATAAGFLVAAGTSALFEPTYSWRIMWLIGIPTGIALMPLSLIIRSDHQAATSKPAAPPSPIPNPSTLEPPPTSTEPAPPTSGSAPATRRIIQFAFAFVTGLTGFALTVWTPSLVKATGAPNAQTLLLTVASALLIASIALAAVHIFFGPRAVLAATAGTTGTALVLLASSAAFNLPPTLASIALLLALFGSNAMASIVLPIAAQSRPAEGRAKFTAEVSAVNRVGGLLGPPLLATLVVSTNATYTAIAIAGSICCLLTIASAVKPTQPGTSTPRH